MYGYLCLFVFQCKLCVDLVFHPNIFIKLHFSSMKHQESAPVFSAPLSQWKQIAYDIEDQFIL